VEKLLTVREIASYTGCHEQTIYRKVEAGEIPFTKIGGRYRFRKKEIDSWMEKNSFKPQVSGLLLRSDLSLDGYDKMHLKRRTELKGQIRWFYGIGSVILRKTKNKEDRYYIDYQLDGRRVRKVLKGVKTRAEAVKILHSKVSECVNKKYGLRRLKQDVDFNEMADKYLEKYAKLNKKSWKTSDLVYLKPLKSFFGDFKLSEITAENIEEYRKERLKTIKKCSVNREVSCLRKILNVAIDWGYLSDNPVKKIKFFSERENLRERFLTEEEAERLFKAACPYLKPILKVAYHTGMRKGEIFKMKWKDIDWRRREIRIPESKGGRERRVPINAELYGLLFELHSKNGVSEYVFTNPKTARPFVDIKRSFKTACKKAGIEDFHFHDLRHTFASGLVRKGEDLVVVKELLGHRSLMTTQRYLHALDKEKRKAVEKLVSKSQAGLCQKSVKPVLVDFPRESLISYFSSN